MGISPFEMDLGWNPKSPLDVISGREETHAALQEFKNNLKESLEDAVYAYKISKAGQSARSSLKYKPHTWSHNTFLLSTKRYWTNNSTET